MPGSHSAPKGSWEEDILFCIVYIIISYVGGFGVFFKRATVIPSRKKKKEKKWWLSEFLIGK